MGTQASRIYIARSGTSAVVTTPVSLAAATAKTVVAFLGTASTTLCVKAWHVTFNSVTATDAPAIVEVGIITALGTNTSFTPQQWSGSTVASGASGGYNNTAEPTYLRVLWSGYVPVQQSLFNPIYVPSEELQLDPSQGAAIRVTSPTAQSCLAQLYYGE